MERNIRRTRLSMRSATENLSKILSEAEVNIMWGLKWLPLFNFLAEVIVKLGAHHTGLGTRTTAAASKKTASKSGRHAGTCKNEVGHGKLVGRRQQPQIRLPRKKDAAPAPAKMDTFSLGIFWQKQFYRLKWWHSLEKWTPARNVRPNIVSRLPKIQRFIQISRSDRVNQRVEAPRG
jgi:hypothetical protein